MEMAPVAPVAVYDDKSFKLALYITVGDQLLPVDDLWYRSVLSSEHGWNTDWFANVTGKPCRYELRIDLTGKVTTRGRWAWDEPDFAPSFGKPYDDSMFDSETGRIWPVSAQTMCGPFWKTN